MLVSTMTVACRGSLLILLVTENVMSLSRINSTGVVLSTCHFVLDDNKFNGYVKKKKLHKRKSKDYFCRHFKRITEGGMKLAQIRKRCA